MFKKVLDDENYEVVKVTYNQSFTARVALTEEKIRNYYRELKEEMLSYEGVRSRISWQYDSFSYKREKRAILTVRENALTIYLKIDPNSITPKYKVTDESGKKSYINTPLSLKVRGSRTLKYAKELISLVFSGQAYKEKKLNDKVFEETFKARSLEEFLTLGLVKEVKKRRKKSSGRHRVKFYAVILTRAPKNLYLVGNMPELGSWDPQKGVKLHKVYDNFYQISVLLPEGHLEFKIVGQNDYAHVEKGIFLEEIKNHHYEINSSLLIEDIIHSFREDLHE